MLIQVLSEVHTRIGYNYRKKGTRIDIYTQFMSKLVHVTCSSILHPREGIRYRRILDKDYKYVEVTKRFEKFRGQIPKN